MSGPLVGSIIIIVVMITVNTTLNYSASLATQSSGTSTTTTASTAPISIEAWNPSTSYPTIIWTQSCVASDSVIICVGGMAGTNTFSDVTSAVYYASLSSSGVGHWTKTTSFPVGIRDGSCVASNAEIYCVGGYTPVAISDAVYYAPISSSGVGQWTNTTSYPFPVWGQSCAASTSEIYCVGGITGPQSNTSAVYSAPLSSSGVGHWTATTSYPDAVIQESCVTSGSWIYCVGGLGSRDVYYAPISSSGVGRWTNTTAYTSSRGLDYPSCVASITDIYCVGGYAGPTISPLIYYAPISSSGVGQWTQAPNYPVGVWGESCVASEGSVYCVGGETPSGDVTSGVYRG
jgi:hypothetical protein